jgi:hypothetical protein
LHQRDEQTAVGLMLQHSFERVHLVRSMIWNFELSWRIGPHI